MTDGGQQFLQELAKEIGNHPEKLSILEEYEVHISDLIQEESIPTDQVYEQLLIRLGTPKEIASMWKQESRITPRKTQWLFVILNSLLFIGGGILTLSYNVLDWNWIEWLWASLTDISIIIMLIYILFWGLLGYEIGREFGHRGRELLRKTFFISVIPNFVFMYLIIFKLIPHEWFQPLLNVPFMVACIVLTAFLYPVSWIGYRWGRKASV
ncbi:hypothetical protein GMD78_13480 [Ornithinibacillus sp. L9]|uniref:Integral inner membrane protein n=1 Tax=Ornithinibacillus caprae TaxID=2678566 RepID=A0A6N8FLX2_9BACI|nr:hypothetical protein [Ornithinibacillus caprae]MUK89374.1 hypothetical protein [Ornithinibacillus caprae]